MSLSEAIAQSKEDTSQSFALIKETITKLIESKNLDDTKKIEYLDNLCNNKDYSSLVSIFNNIKQEIISSKEETDENIEIVGEITETANKVNIKSKPVNSKFKPTIAVYGLLNAGKSYLLNMLSDHIEEEFFKCSDARETVDLKKFEGKDYIYLDTPGLDANNDDDLTAYQGRDSANIIIFVHQASSELDKLEVDFLKDVQNKLGSSMEQSVILAISKIDNLENQQDLNALSSKIADQWENILGYRPQAFNVAAKRYAAGYQNNKLALMKKSGIYELQKHIKHVCNTVDFAALQKTRNNIQIKDTIEQLKVERQKLIESHNNIATSFSDEMLSFANSGISGIADIISDMNSLDSLDKDIIYFEDEVEDYQDRIDDL